MTAFLSFMLIDGAADAWRSVREDPNPVFLAVSLTSLATALDPRAPDLTGERFLALANGLDYFGDGKYLLAADALGWGISKLAGSSLWAKAFENSLEAWVLAGLAAQVLKWGVGRARPWAGEGPWSFRPGSAEERYHSFPSGHTTVAFAAASGLGFTVKNPWVMGAGLAVASGVAWARVYQDVHWPSDVVAGALLGLGFGYVSSLR